LNSATLSNLFIRKDIKSDINDLINENNNKLITTSCGFFYYLQKDVVDKLNKQIFISPSLIQLPLLLNIISNKEKIGIITANSNSLNNEYLSSHLSIDANRIIIQGMEDKKEFNECIIENKRDNINLNLMKTEIIDTISMLLKNNKSISILLIECTDIDFVANDIKKQFKIPVFNLISLLNMMYKCIY